MASQNAQRREEATSPSRGQVTAGGAAPDSWEDSPLAASQERVAGPLDVLGLTRRVRLLGLDAAGSDGRLTA